MKVFSLGGYGKVGLPANKLLAQTDLVSEIAIVGRNLERAEKAATEIGEKAIAIQADSTNEQKLTSLMEGYDLIVNAANNEFVLPSIRAAIHNRAHYCDVAFGGAAACAPSGGCRYYGYYRQWSPSFDHQFDGSACGETAAGGRATAARGC